MYIIFILFIIQIAKKPTVILLSYFLKKKVTDLLGKACNFKWKTTANSTDESAMNTKTPYIINKQTSKCIKKIIYVFIYIFFLGKYFVNL